MTEETLDRYRAAAAAVGLCLRPRRFPPKEENHAEEASPAQDETVAEEAPATSVYSSTQVKFLPLRHPHGLQGVLQVHEAGPSAVSNFRVHAHA